MKRKRILDVDAISKIQRDFVKEREWEKFHTPKNLAIALGIEASELAEIFLWLTDKESLQIMKKPRTAIRVKEELADVLYWVIRLSDLLQIDLQECFEMKMALNRKKYPVEQARGSARKYTDL